MKFNTEIIIMNVEEARKILEKEGQKYTDEQIRKLIGELETFSQILIDSSLLEELAQDDTLKNSNID